MKTKFLTQLFLVAFVSLSLYSCTADPVDDTTQKNNVIPKISVPAAEVENNTVVEPVVPRPK
jgi:cytochrome oxidase Cu insertion factor (SCO1/SenC/PrrC family)